MVPIYGSVFRIEKGELKNERFLNRLWRLGLEDFLEKGLAGDQGETEKTVRNGQHAG